VLSGDLRGARLCCGLALPYVCVWRYISLIQVKAEHTAPRVFDCFVSCLLYFCTFSVQTQLHYCVLEKKLDPLCSIITSLAPRYNIRTRYSRVLPCFIVLALRPLLRCTWELHLRGGMQKLAVISSIFSVILKLQFWTTCCRDRRGIILRNIAHPYRVIICCGWCACARAELNCLF